MRVKIITEYSIDSFEEKLKAFIEDVNVLEIKFSSSKAMSGFETLEMYFLIAGEAGSLKLTLKALRKNLFHSSLCF